jgi:leucyl aminopeptidase
VLADEVRRACEAVGLTVTVLDEHEIDRLGMGLLAGVGRGSAEPPRMVAIEYRPRTAGDTAVLGLVGKGITFDTGGISIKPAESMDRMKYDMCGAAAVVAAMHAIARLGAPRRVIGVIAAAENMPDGRAMRPGDVLRGAGGKTVEINNTDAEGRLVLGDALWWAQELGATHLVDVATLTGAIGIALGRSVAGLFAAPDSWRARVQAAGEASGDRLWPMPVDDDYLEAMKSDIADLVNAGGRAGGSITAAVFLKEFAGGKPWAHLDIAGTAWADEGKPWMPKGPTGVAARTLIDLACGVPDLA